MGIVVHSSDTSILTCNRAAADILGLTIEQVIGKKAADPSWEFIHEDMSTMSIEDYPVSKVISSGKPLKNYLAGIEKPDQNSLAWITANAIPLFGESGNLDKVIVHFTDITKHKKAEQELKASTEKFQVMYDNAPLCYQSLDINGCFLDVNPTWLTVLGYTGEEVLGNSFIDFLHPDWKQNFKINFPAFKKCGFVNDVQFKIRHKNGSYLHISFAGRVATNSDGAFKQTHCVFKDITDKKKAEDDLRESEERFSAAIESISDCILIWDQDYNYLYANQSAIDHVGSTREQVIGKNIRDGLGHMPDFMHLWMQRIDSVFATGEILKVSDTTEMRGKLIHTSSVLSPVMNAQNKVEAVCVVYRDITYLKTSEEALRESEIFIRNISENSTNLFYAHTPDHILTYVSPQVEKILGYTIEEAMKCWTEFVSDNPLNEIGFACTMKAIETGERQPPYELEFVRKDGKKVWADVREFPQVENGKTIAIMGSLAEITEKKLSEKMLIESEERFRLIYENSPDMYASVSPVDATILNCNKTMLRNTGYSRNEIVGSPVFLLYHPDSLEDAEDTFKQFVRTGSVQDRKLVLKRKDGSKLHTSLNLNAVRDSAGRILYSISSWRDISQWLDAEKAVRASENKFRTVFENRGTATGLFDENGVIKDCNSVFVEMSGYSREEIVDKIKWSDLVYKEDLPRLWKYHTERGASDSSAPAQYECRVCSKQGKLMDAILNVAMVGDIRIVSLIDISEHKKADAEIRRMQKLEGLGTVAGGIAHDFNNLLTGVFGNLEMARLDLPETSPSWQYLQEAHHAIQSARRLTGQLLTFAKGGTPVFKSVETASLLKETVEFNLHGCNVISQIELADDLWPVKADRGQIEQVIANLTINSKQAMPGGGVLHIEAENSPFSSSSGEFDLKCDSVVITIRDEGIGIPSKIIDNIFDPYFTTKDQGHGLGLAIVHSIITQHSGLIKANSTADEGATFTITLPAVPPAESSDTAECIQAGKTTSADSNLHILIMDDEQMVRSIAEQLLQRMGHTTDTAVDGDEAIMKYTGAFESNNPFDLIMMDLTIRGGKGGKETIKELLQIYPDAKVIVSSGYASGPIMADYSAYGFAGKLAKPYTVADLRDEIIRVSSSIPGD